MTNRERIEAMTDEQLAKFIFDAKVLFGGEETCCTGRCTGRTCVECMTEWLRTEVKPKKGDVRKIGDKYYMVVRVDEKESKLMFSDGSFVWASNDIFLTDGGVSDMSVDDFLKMVFRNL